MGSAPYLGGGFGHFFVYAPNKLKYPINRYSMEVKRQLSVLDKRLSDCEFVSGSTYSIADMAIWPWTSLWKRQDQNIQLYPKIKRWLERCKERPGVQKGRSLLKEKRSKIEDDQQAQKILFR
jgi:GST-like protein